MSLRPKSVDFNATWSPLKDSVLRIMTLQHISRAVWDNHFHDVYALCVACPKDHSQSLHEEMRICLENHVKALYEDVIKNNDNKLLEAYCERWTVYNKGADYVDKLFGYLNNQFVKKQKYTDVDMNYGGITIEQLRASLLEIGEMALEIWRRIMIAPMEDKLVALLLDSICKDRQGLSVHSAVIKMILSSFVEVEKNRVRDRLELYENLFENKFLEHTSDHYGIEASNLLQSLDCSHYMQKVLSRLREEDMRSRRFLDPSSYEKVTKVCQKAMVEDHLDFLTSFIKPMVKNEQSQDLSNLYTLVKPLSKPQGLEILVKEFENHVKTNALNCVSSLKGDNVPHQFVEGLLTIHHTYSRMVSSVFQNDQEFIGALDKACLAAVNYREDNKTCPKASEWLAKYTDHLLRKSAKGLSENEIDDKLSSAIIIFRYIEDKDIFQKFYSRMLAQRLIHGLSVTMDTEEAMIAKLKEACGYEFTSKLQRMFTDIGLSKDLTLKFTSFLETQQETLDHGFQIQVLQAGAWPLTTNQLTTLAVPRELNKSVHLFEKFYNNNFTGRKLTWLLHWATADVRLNYLCRLYTITMTVPQLAILLHFNEGIDECTVEELRNSTQLTDEFLPKNIKSLLDCGLLRVKPGGDLNDSSRVSLNMNFTSKRNKFKISAPTLQKQTEKEAEHVNTTVQQDRKYFLECTIVRIMKTRKICKHNQLIQDVINQSRARFSPEVTFIKKIIEQLIEKQYLQRTENQDEYAYLA